MKKLLLSLILFPFSFLSNAQYFTQYFDGADTNVWGSVFVEYDTTTFNIWQVGPPQKIVFDAPSTVPNVLVTDTVNYYPDSLSSSAWFVLPENSLFAGGLAIQWNQKIDFDLNQDGGVVEFSSDSGATWQNAFGNPNVYNFYGWDIANEGVLPSTEPCLTGTDSTWKNVWLCFIYDYLWTIDNLSIRFRIVSDSIETNQEGWMIDNIMVAETWFHPVNEQSQPDNFKVYPTVSNQTITIEQINTSPDITIVAITLLDINGKIKKTISPSSGINLIDVSDLPTGKYFLKIETNLRKEMHSIIISR